MRSGWWSWCIVVFLILVVVSMDDFSGSLRSVGGLSTSLSSVCPRSHGDVVRCSISRTSFDSVSDFSVGSDISYPCALSLVLTPVLIPWQEAYFSVVPFLSLI